MSWVRRTARALGALVLVVVPVALAPVAFAAPPDGAAELSVDGTTWSANPTASIFDPAFVWVPGDVETGTLYARTRACDAAAGSAVVTLGPQDATLAADLDVRMRVDGGAWTAGTTSGAFTVATGQVARLDVEVTFDPASGNELQGRTVPLTVTVTLSCDEAVASATPTPTASPVAPPAQTAGSGFLPRTGVEIARTLVAAAALAVVGTWLVLATRRREAGDA